MRVYEQLKYIVLYSVGPKAKGPSSMAVAEDLRPTAMATVAEVLGHSYGGRSYW